MTALNVRSAADLLDREEESSLARAENAPAIERPLAVAIPIFLVWSFFAWRRLIAPGAEPIPVAVWTLMCVALSAPITATFALALRLSDRFPIVGGSRQGFAIHLVALGSVYAFDELIRMLLVGRSPIPPVDSPLGVRIGAVLFYFGFALCAQGARYWRDAERVEAARLKLRAQLVEAGRRRAESELHALKAELNPHFLGNALQGVKALMRTDVDGAERVLTSLGELLRTTLTRARTQETTLEEELESVLPFVDVARTRLGGRLDLAFDIDSEANSVLVPDMILQPLVENSVKHGLLPLGGGRVRISARRSANPQRLELIVEDDGIVLGSIGTTRSSGRTGVGLANIRARLKELYADQATLELMRAGLGTVVRISMPWRDASDLGSTRDMSPARGARATGMERTRSDLADDDPRSVALLAFKVFATALAWTYLARATITNETRSAIVNGFADSWAYTRVDAAITAALVAAEFHVAAWWAKRWRIGSQANRPRFAIWRAIGRALLGGAAIGIAICIAKICVAASFDYWVLLDAPHLRRNVPAAIIGTSVTFVLAYFVGLMYLGLRDYYVSKKRRIGMQAELDEMRRRSADAELRALKADLNPHFIGNALNAVTVLMRTNIEAAERVIDQLSDLLQAAVDRAATQEVTLREELELLEPFLAVERVRLSRSLDVRVSVEERAFSGRVPHMILQPLVENAVKHGLAHRSGGRIDVRATRFEHQLELLVCNDGPDSLAPRAGLTRGGTGMANVRARLSQLYGNEASLELLTVADGGAVARVLIPWHDASTPLTM